MVIGFDIIERIRGVPCRRVECIRGDLKLIRTFKKGDVDVVGTLCLVSWRISILYMYNTYAYTIYIICWIDEYVKVRY